MAWLRVDDGFAFHPKIVLLSRSERWTWVELLCYCARYKTDGGIPDNIHHVIPKANRAFLTRCIDIGLLDEDENGVAVHDWAEYNPRDANAAERMRKRRETMPSTEQGQWKRTRAQVFARDGGFCADCGKDCTKPGGDGRDVWNADHEPDRTDLIARGDSIYDTKFIVTRCHSCHSKATRRRANAKRTQTEREPNIEPNESDTRARASRPVPTNKEPSLPSNESRHAPPEGLEGLKIGMILKAVDA